MSKSRPPAILDLFCGAGGSSVGYARAGFEITGVDIHRQHRYPYRFVLGDALEFLRHVDLRKYGFVAVHASPPCQAYTILHKQGKRKHPDLIAEVRSLLVEQEILWVIENVPGSPLVSPVTLCGTMFPGLRVIRHRNFESNVSLSAPPHPSHPPVFTRDRRSRYRGRAGMDEWNSYIMVNGGGNTTLDAARDAMGIPWMRKAELNEAIPPVYTEFLGRQLMVALGLRRPAKKYSGWK